MCKFVIGEIDVLDNPVGVKDVQIYLMAYFERETAQEQGVNLCVWLMVACGGAEARGRNLVSHDSIFE